MDHKEKTSELRHNRKPMVSSLLLRSVPLFSGLAEEVLAKLAQRAQRLTIARGSTIIQAGDLTTSLYVVLSGTVKICSQTKKGRENILSTLGPREFFGEMALIDDQPRSADVVALEDVEILQIERDQLLACMRSDFDVCMEVIVSLTKRLRNADRKIASLVLLNVEGRVKSLLQDMTVREVDGRYVIRNRLSRQGVARMVGASREMVSRVMRDFEASGFLKKEGRTYIVAYIQSPSHDE